MKSSKRKTKVGWKHSQEFVIHMFFGLNLFLEFFETLDCTLSLNAWLKS